MNKQFTIKGLPNDLMTNEVVNERKLKTDGTAKDFLFELAQGNIPGQSSFGFITKNDNVGTDRVDQWDDASMMIYPANDAISEVWEISSTSPNDTNGGTGAWNAIVISLDEDFLRVTHTVDLNGTTPVTIPDLHTRPHQVILPDSGSSDANEGKITVRVVGSGLLRNTVRIGESLSFDGHFTVPADKKAFIMQTYTNFGKNLDGNARTTIKDASNIIYAQLNNHYLKEKKDVTESVREYYRTTNLLNDIFNEHDNKLLNEEDIIIKCPFILEKMFNIPKHNSISYSLEIMKLF